MYGVRQNLLNLILMMLGGVIVIRIEDDIELSISLEQLCQLLMVFVDVLAVGLEVEVFEDAKRRTLGNVGP